MCVCQPEQTTEENQPNKMFPEKLLFLQVSILFCILTQSTHSLHVQTRGGNGPTTTHNTGPFGSYRAAVAPQVAGGPVEEGEMGAVDSNRLSNVNRISYSPLLMLPMQHHQNPGLYHHHQQQQPILHRANPSANAQHQYASTSFSKLHQQQEEAEEEAILADLVGDRSRIATSHQFGEMRMLGNSRHRPVAGGGAGEEMQGHLLTIGKQVPYKRQEQFLKPTAHHVEHKAALESNELPSAEVGGGGGLRMLKKEQQQSSLSSSIKNQPQQPGDAAAVASSSDSSSASAAASSSSADKGARIQVSKKSLPFMEDTEQMIPHSIASQLMLRSARGQRQYDIPQIGEWFFLFSC